MEKQETPRQKKINTVLQQEIASLLQEAIRKGSVSNLMVSITKVHVTADLSIAKIYLSVFPNDTALNYFENIKNSRFQIRHDLSQRMKNQLRRIPELKFYLDDSLDYIETIEEDLSNGENPIKISSSGINGPEGCLVCQKVRSLLSKHSCPRAVQRKNLSRNRSEINILPDKFGFYLFKTSFPVREAYWVRV